MRRSLLLRLLGLSLAVAACAVAATAWLTTQSTSDALRGEFARTIDADTFAYQALLAYAGEHSSWDGVEETVREVATRTGRRVALTTPTGEIVADSARILGEGSPKLPANPAATLDIMSPNSMAMAMFPLEAAAGAGGSAGVVVNSKAAFAGFAAFGVPMWGATEAELDERRKLTAAANECLAERYPSTQVEVDIAGNAYQVSSSESGLAGAEPVGREPMGAAEELINQIHSKKNECVPAALSAPSAQMVAYSKVETKLVIGCLDAASVPYNVTTTNGLTAVKPTMPEDVRLEPGEKPTKPAPAPTPTKQSKESESSKQSMAEGGEPIVDKAEWSRCYETARAQAMKPYVAPAALLYLGSSGQFDAFSADGWWRTATTALAVLVVAALITLVGGQQLVRPIRALTNAAQRMEAGDRAARVPVSGGDEVARLGHAFNSMASAIEAGEHQRRAMVSDVAHELRTPLANVRGYLEAAEDGVVPLDPALVRSLLEEAGLLERLVSDLQMLALADAGMLRIYPEETDASDVTQQVVAAHRALADAGGVSLTASVPGALPFYADPHRMRQALGNLVANALRFTPAGGSVVVSVSRSARQVVWTVADTGPGIAPEHLPHLFDRFYRADPSRSRATGGSGLGLAITRHLVEAQGGQVEVASEVGRGSTFVIRLPASTTVA